MLSLFGKRQEILAAYKVCLVCVYRACVKSARHEPARPVERGAKPGRTPFGMNC